MVEAVVVGVVVVASSWIGAAFALDRMGRRSPARAGWDWIVVAGCRVLADGAPSPALARRADLAARLWHAGYAPRVVASGWRAPSAPASEAEVIGALLRARGVPAEVVVHEDRARTTRENASETRRAVGAGRVLVVTDAWHAPRCAVEFRRHFDVVGTAGAPGAEVLPRAALREVVAFLLAWWRGR